MQRIRTVKPELFRHEGLFEAEQVYQLPLRLAFIGLFSCCDREGRFRWKPKQLKLDIFPYDENADMSRVLDALMTRGFIVQYACGTELYGCIPSWHKHQCINHREAVSLLPGPDENTGLLETAKNDASGTREARVNDVSGADPGMPMGKGKGRELEKEREKEGNRKGKTRDASLTRQAHIDDASIQIFEHWKKVMRVSHAVLDSKRREIIRSALKTGYTPEQLCHAIEGCKNTPHNMGKNEHGQRYDGLHIIFRDADQIDRFMRNFYQPPQPVQAGEKRTQSSRQNLQNWLDKKTNSKNQASEEAHENH